MFECIPTGLEDLVSIRIKLEGNLNALRKEGDKNQTEPSSPPTRDTLLMPKPVFRKFGF